MLDLLRLKMVPIRLQRMSKLKYLALMWMILLLKHQ